MPRHVDSLGKIVTTYFAAVCAAPFVYGGVTYKVKPLHVSPLIFRHYTCPAGCGACCPRFSLTYLPDEPHPYRLASRVVEFNGRRVELAEDSQADRVGEYHCRNLQKHDGRCGVHGRQPMTCDIELVRVLAYPGRHVLMQRLYGRAWNMLRVDGQRGTLCEMTAQSESQKADLVRRLDRLRSWCVHFGLPHKLDRVIQWCVTGPHPLPLMV